jgi:hypothetical protein
LHSELRSSHIREKYVAFVNTPEDSAVLDGQDYRALWSQVVLQAKQDLEAEQLGSVLYGEAESFFLGAGQWAETRAAIATMIDLHADDLTRLGRATIAARRLEEGLPPLPDPIAPPPAASVPMPALIAIPAPGKAYSGRRHRRYGPDNNPFAPSFRAAS